jgi:hypothetical protein
MRGHRNIGSLKPNLPPFRPLSADEVDCIARAGGIEFQGHHDSAQQFRQALDDARELFKIGVEAREYCLTDLQISKRLTEALCLAKRLRKRLDDPGLWSWTVPAEHAAKLLPYQTKFIEPLDTIVHWAESGLKELSERSIKNPYTFTSAQKPEKDLLLTELVHLWRVATGTIDTHVAKNSHLIPFLREAMRVITQYTANPPTVVGWARTYTQRVSSRPIDRGYSPWRR